MKRLLNIGILGMLLLFALQATAQKRRFNPKQRFHAGIIVGANLSQIDGDRFSGYDKRGIVGGLQGIAVISRRINLVTELLYSQKGSRIEYNDLLFTEKKRILGLNYAEAPILVRIKLISDLENYRPLELETGFSIARLLSSDIREELNRLDYSFTEVATDFKRTDLNYIIGMHFELLPNFNLGVRSNISLTNFYQDELTEEEKRQRARFGNSSGPYTLFRNYHLSFYASYQIY
ncbi:MAG: outer membrane beta-barrel protein [Bacteroidota bacterium]